MEIGSEHIRTCVYFFRDARRKSRSRHFKTKRWPLGAMYFFLLDSSINNAFVIYRDGGNATFANYEAKSTLVDEIIRLLTEASGRNWSLEECLSKTENGDRRFIHDELFPSSSNLPSSMVVSTPTDSSSCNVEDCLSTEVASLSPAEVDRRRLLLGYRHYSIKCTKRAPCVMHKKRMRTFYHCLDCGVALHPGVCHRIFHSVQDISSVDVDKF